MEAQPTLRRLGSPSERHSTPLETEEMDMPKVTEFEALPFELEEEGVFGESDFMFEAYEGEGEFETAVPSGSDLLRIIPDRSDFHRFIPLEYRLDAKAIVGKLAQDLQELKSPSANDLRKAAGDTINFVAGTSIKAPVKILIDTLKNIPGGYLGAAANIAREWAARGFSRGVVLGADGRSKSYMLELFGRGEIGRFDAFPYGRRVAIANYGAGLVAGFVQGRSLSPRQKVIFWRDLGHRMGDQSKRGPQSQWNRAQWRNWYLDVSIAFWRYHLN
jgi:hypothetical protein